LKQVITVSTTTGLDFWTAFTAVAACLNVLGPAFGELGANFQPVSDIGTWILTFTMLLGRLEFYCVLVLLTPAYWRY
jgi:trk system potassium uptake protein TrkH